MPRHPRANCPKCGRTVALRKDRRFHIHYGLGRKYPDDFVPCSMSGREDKGNDDS
ncbi:hypothetical protein LCGC14_1326130 [marine sediment metagenome]|uniref:Uncharacterized protein n=1 Tax=marine sediment metagenome TaxID=412755 RepID=A0A0F9NKF4_9ZZZZ